MNTIDLTPASERVWNALIRPLDESDLKTKAGLSQGQLHNGLRELQRDRLVVKRNGRWSRV